jgi:hypothetical protein
MKLINYNISREQKRRRRKKIMSSLAFPLRLLICFECLCVCFHQIILRKGKIYAFRICSFAYSFSSFIAVWCNVVLWQTSTNVSLVSHKVICIACKKEILFIFRSIELNMWATALNWWYKMESKHTLATSGSVSNEKCQVKREILECA